MAELAPRSPPRTPYARRRRGTSPQRAGVVQVGARSSPSTSPTTTSSNRSRHDRRGPPGQRPRAARTRRRRGRRVPEAPRRAARRRSRSSSASSASSSESRPCTTRWRRAVRGRLHGPPRDRRPGSCSSASEHSTLWRSRRLDDRPPWRYPRRACSSLAVSCSLVFALRSSRSRRPTSSRTRSRAEVPAAEPRRRVRGRRLHDERRAQPRGLVRALAERRDRDRLPRPVGPAAADAACSCRTATASCCSTAAARARARATPTCSAGRASATCTPPRDYLRSRPDVDPGRIGGIGLSVGGEMLIRRRGAVRRVRGRRVRGRERPVGARRPCEPAASARGILSTPCSTLATAVFTNGLPPPSLRSDVAQIAPHAVFLIYGEHGQGGSETKPNRVFYECATSRSTIWEVPDAQHVGRDHDPARASTSGA